MGIQEQTGVTVIREVQGEMELKGTEVLQVCLALEETEESLDGQERRELLLTARMETKVILSFSDQNRSNYFSCISSLSRLYCSTVNLPGVKITR